MRPAVRGCLLLAAVFTIPLAALRPLQNIPFADDWTYAWPVENLLESGTLRILDWSTSINVAQVLWGALFSLPFGFSFTALRLSTWVLSVAALAGLYLLLREMNVSPRHSILGVLALLLSPWYLLLSFSFMTDVPAMAFMIWALYFLCRAIESPRGGWILAGAGCSILAIATRLTGLVIPLAVLAVALSHWRTRRPRLPFTIAAGVIPLVFGGLLLYWHSHHIEYRADLTWIEGSPAGRTRNLEFALLDLPFYSLITAAYIFPSLGALLLPIAAACAASSHVRKILAAGAVLLLLFAIGYAVGVLTPAHYGLTWLWEELDGSRRFVAAADYPAAPPGWNMAAGWAGLAAFCLAAGPAMSAPALVRPKAVLLRWTLAAQAGMSALLWLWNVRYVTAFVPGMLVLILAAAPVRRPRLALALIVGMGSLAVGLVHDELQYNTAMWKGADLLLERGAPIPRINGGYVVNGWLQYAHRENALNTADGDVEVNFVNVATQDFDYLLSNKPDAAWIQLGVFPFTSWLSESGAMYVLARPADAAKEP